MTYIWSGMTPGERDALIAEKVMGWDVYTRERPHDQYVLDEDEVAFGYPPHKPMESPYNVPFEIPAYSTDMNAAWKVVDALLDKGIYLFIHPTKTYTNIHRAGYQGEYAHAESAAESICLAALRAMGVDVA